MAVSSPNDPLMLSDNDVSIDNTPLSTGESADPLMHSTTNVSFDDPLSFPTEPSDPPMHPAINVSSDDPLFSPSASTDQLMFSKSDVSIDNALLFPEEPADPLMYSTSNVSFDDPLLFPEEPAGPLMPSTRKVIFGDPQLSAAAPADALMRSSARLELPDSLMYSRRSLTQDMPPARIALDRPPTVISRAKDLPAPKLPTRASMTHSNDMLMVSLRSIEHAEDAEAPALLQVLKLPRVSIAPNITLRNRNVRMLGHVTRDKLKDAKSQLKVFREQLQWKTHVRWQDVLSPTQRMKETLSTMHSMISANMSYVPPQVC